MLVFPNISPGLSRRSFGIVGGDDPGEWSPADLFADSQVGAWYDPSDLSTLWQDVAGTIPVTASGQKVARMDDKSGNGNHMLQADEPARPTLEEAAGIRWIYFDGVDDFMTTTTTWIVADDITLALAGRALEPVGSSNNTSHFGLADNESGGSNYIRLGLRPRDGDTTQHAINARWGTGNLRTIRIDAGATGDDYALMGWGGDGINLRVGDVTDSDTTEPTGSGGAKPLRLGNLGARRVYGAVFVDGVIDSEDRDSLYAHMEGTYA